MSTAVVQRTDLSDSVSIGGTLHYGSPRAVSSAVSGTVTWLPVVGATIEAAISFARTSWCPASARQATGGAVLVQGVPAPVSSLAALSPGEASAIATVLDT